MSGAVAGQGTMLQCNLSRMSTKTERGGDVSGPVGNAASVAYATQYTLAQLRHTTLFYVLYSQTRCTLEA